MDIGINKWLLTMFKVAEYNYKMVINNVLSEN